MTYFQAPKKEKKSGIGILPVVFTIVLFAFLFFRGSTNVTADYGAFNVRGWAWSSNFGWISFNCIDQAAGGCATNPYGVKICDGTCPPDQQLNFQGNAWSPNAGWITFEDGSETPDNHGFKTHCQSTLCDASHNCTACFNPDDGFIYGWAKVVNLGDDGWIKLGSTTAPWLGAGGGSFGNSGGGKWTYQVVLTVDHTKVPASQTNFPVLVTNNNLPKTIFTKALSTGCDIRFSTDMAGTIEVPLEKAVFNTGTNQAEFWVNLPSVSSVTDTTFYIWYGNPSATCYVPTDTNGRNNVWDANYVAVWHFNEATGVAPVDSTSNGNVSALTGTAATTGKIGGALSFNGSSYVSVTDSASLNSVTSGMTLSAWFNTTSGGTGQKIVGKSDGLPSRGYMLANYDSGGADTEVWNTSGTHYRAHGNGTPTNNTWYYYAATWQTSGNLIAYQNGSQVNSVADGAANIGSTAGRPARIGVAPYDPLQYYVTGKLDEIRISKIARTPQWITTEYNNQSSPETFISSSTEQNLSYFTFGLKIDQNSASGTFLGWGWNGNADPTSGLGWISFNCNNTGTCGTVDYSVYLAASHRPTSTPMSAPNWSYADACPASGAAHGIARAAKLKWQFGDSDSGSYQSAYRVIVNASNSTTSPLLDTGKVTKAMGGDVQQKIIDSTVLANYDTPYYWWVKIWDNFGYASKWRQFNTTNGDILTDNKVRNGTVTGGSTRTFTTYRHEFPEAKFSHLPSVPLAYYPVTSTLIGFYYTDASRNTPIACIESRCSTTWSGVNVLTNSTPLASTTVMTFKYSHNSNPNLNAKINLLLEDIGQAADDNYYCSSSTNPFFVDQTPIWKEIKAQ
ncbi:MAG TPA: DUF2341 domain-containing protein [Candidatus Methylomirabilis sp.]|nr:DUF2341 domain-containing protein [Candidatus Methylomirabilis sp.]